MHPMTFLALLEEMIDIKVQQQTESHLKASPEVAAVLHQKRETDKRRVDQIRAELLRLMSA
jgi:3-phenylpropionate/cinnamic acid dioxygenase small subunit